MTAQTILPANSSSSESYQVDNSLKFNGSNDKLTITPGTAGNRRTWTWSSWVKRSSHSGIGGTTGETLFHCYDGSSSTRGLIQFQSHDHVPADTIKFDTGGSNSLGSIYTAAVNRDLSAWLHIVAVLDTTNSTATDRQRIYVNGVRLSVTVSNQVAQNYDGLINTTNEHEIGTHGGGSFFNGYMAETVLIDGQALDPTLFGEFDSDSGIWKPIDVSGLTFGDEGFYLEFKGSGTSANASGLGADTSGNTNHFAVTNLTAVDQTTDTCTNNFATLNPLMNNKANLPTITEGNLEVLAVSGSTWSVTPSTIGLPKSGKWYYEVEAVSGTSGDRAAFAGWMNPAVTNPLGNGSILWRNVSANNSILSNDSAASGTFSATTWGTNGHIIGLYIDMDNLKLYFAHNGTIQNSGTGIDFQGTFDDDTFILPVVMVINTDKLSVNFGNPAANFAIASGNADVNGFGNFEYDPSAGSFDGASKDFLAICTKNLAEVT